MKANRLAPAVSLVGALKHPLKWSNLVSVKEADYICLVTLDPGFTVPIERAVSKLESNGASIAFFLRGSYSDFPPFDVLVIRRDLFEDSGLAKRVTFDSVLKAWLLAETKVQIPKDIWHDFAKGIPVEPSANLSALRERLVEATRMVAWLKRSGNSDHLDGYLSYLADIELLPYLLAIEASPVMYFAQLKFLLLESKLPLDGDLLAIALKAVRTGSRAETLRALREFSA